MKSFLATGLILSLLAFSTACDRKPKLDTDTQRASYAIGQQIGSNLKSQSIEFDAKVLAASIQEAAEGKESRMQPEEMQQALMKLQENIVKKQQEEAESNSKSGLEFLEKNKTAEGVKTTASGLQYIVEAEGTGRSPGPNDTVKAHYRGTLITGEQFDSSFDRGQPAEFPVDGVIRGWTEALQLMKVGGKVKLFIPPELGYGPSARPGIPANSVLLFDVELIDVIPAKKK